MFILKLEIDCWVAEWDGDPGRTIVKENAQQFKTDKLAQKALGNAQKYRPFENAEIEKL